MAYIPVLPSEYGELTRNFTRLGFQLLAALLFPLSSLISIPVSANLPPLFECSTTSCHTIMTFGFSAGDIYI